MDTAPLLDLAARLADHPDADVRRLALLANEAGYELNRRDCAADAADRARREADRAGAVGEWIVAASGAV